MSRISDYVIAGSGAALALLVTVEVNAAEAVEELIVLGANSRTVESVTLGLPTSVFETPRALQVVPAESWEMRNVTHPNEALRLTSGFAQGGSYGGFRPAFSLRSFGVSRILDDGFNVIGSSGARTSELSAYSRIEALKGPTGTEYGNISSGGIINFVSRMPLPQDDLEVSTQFDSRGQRRGIVDATAAEVGGGVSLRGVAVVEDSDTFRDHMQRESLFLSPSMSWRFNDTTRVNAVVRYQEATGTFDQGLPTSPLSLDLPRSRFFGEPSDEADFKTRLARLWLEHDLTDQVKMRFGVNKSRTTYDNTFWSPRGSVNTTNRTFTQAAVFERNTVDEEVVQGKLTGRFQFHPDWRSDFLAAVEWQKEQVRPMSVSGAQLVTNSLDTPLSGRTFPVLADNFRTEKQKWVALTLQTQQTWRDMLTLSAGVRVDSSEVSRLVEASGLYRELDNTEASPFVGVSYRPLEYVNLYANYATSYTNQIGAQLADSGMPDPLLGKQYEAGVKLGSDRIAGTFSVYEITQRNVLTASDVPGISVQTGEVRTRGLEIELSARLLEGLTIQSAYTYLDAEVTEDNEIPPGTKLKDDSRHNLNVWTRYQLPASLLEGFSVGAGVFYVGERDGGGAGFFPSYTRYDASLSYDADQWQASLYFENIGNEKYHYRRGPVLMPQAPFTASARVAYSF